MGWLKDDVKKPGWDNPRDPRPDGAQKGVLCRDYGGMYERALAKGPVKPLPGFGRKKEK